MFLLSAGEVDNFLRGLLEKQTNSRSHTYGLVRLPTLAKVNVFQTLGVLCHAFLFDSYFMHTVQQSTEVHLPPFLTLYGGEGFATRVYVCSSCVSVETDRAALSFSANPLQLGCGQPPPAPSCLFLCVICCVDFPGLRLPGLTDLP